MFLQDINSWSTKNKAFFEPFTDVHKINSNILEQITRENLSLMSDNMAACVKLTQLTNKMNRPEEFYKSSLNLISGQIERNFEYSKNLLNILEDGFKDGLTLGEEKMSSAFTEQAEKMKARKGESQ